MKLVDRCIQREQQLEKMGNASMEGGVGDFFESGVI
jgi:hypothetical protein